MADERSRLAAWTESRLNEVRLSNEFAYVVKQGCKPRILKRAIRQYTIRSVQPREFRADLNKTGITYSQIEAQAKATKKRCVFLQKLQRNPHLVMANEISQIESLYWSECLKSIGEYLRSLEVISSLFTQRKSIRGFTGNEFLY